MADGVWPASWSSVSELGQEERADGDCVRDVSLLRGAEELICRLLKDGATRDTSSLRSSSDEALLIK